MDVLACDHQTACFLGLWSAREQQTASSFGFKKKPLECADEKRINIRPELLWQPGLAPNISVNSSQLISEKHYNTSCNRGKYIYIFKLT